MKKLEKIEFTFEDGTKVAIEDPRAARLFQSRCNSSGILVDLEPYLEEVTEEEPKSCNCDKNVPQ